MKRFLFFALFLVLLTTTPALAEEMDFGGESLPYDQVVGFDLNDMPGDELQLYYAEGQLVVAAFDEGGDGTPEDLLRYGADDTLLAAHRDTTGDGRPDLLYRVEADGRRTPLENRESVPPLLKITAAVVGVLVLLLLLLYAFLRKKKTTALLLILTLTATTLPWAAAEGLTDENCAINEEAFASDWLKYSDIDDRIDLVSRSFEAQEAVRFSDQIRDHYEAMYQLTEALTLEEYKRQEAKNTKNLLVRNLKNNYLKAFMRLSYVTYTTIKMARGNKDAVKKILDTGTAGVQVLTSSYKVLKSLTPPDASAGTKSASDRATGIANSAVLELFDSGFSAKDVTVNLINDLQKETFDVVKTVDNWDDPNLSEADFQLLRDQQLRNKTLDALIAMLDRNIEVIRDELAFHEEAVQLAESDYQASLAAEKERVRQMLIEDCKRQKEREEDQGEEDGSPPMPPAVEEPIGSVPTTQQLAGFYTAVSDARVYDPENGPQNVSGTSTTELRAENETTLTFVDFTSDILTGVPYDPETGHFELTASELDITYTLSGRAFFEGSTPMLEMVIDGGDGMISFHFDVLATKNTAPKLADGIPPLDALPGLYMMNVRTVDTREGEAERGSQTLEVYVAFVNGHVVFGDTAGYFTRTPLPYDAGTGTFSYEETYEETTLSISGNARVADGILRIEMQSLQTEPEGTFEGSYVLEKFQ